MKEKTKRKLRTFVCLLMIPVFLTGCRIKTTPLGVFAQILEYASASGSSSSQSSHHGTYHSEPASTPQPQIDYDSLGDIGTVQTIMIYMVGSDLESSYGNASLDMDEMEAAGVDTAHNNVIVYAGGASQWQDRGLDGDACTTLLLTEDGFAPLDTYPAENMGDPLTLSSFMNYCFDFFPADSYSLLLWDHGGGPVLGYGVDENYRDLLTLDELSEALADSVGAHMTKLEWIGFDACLMSSLEVASVLAPYADYMIASQETEPGWGWNYAFLSVLSDRAIPGDEMGEYIVDSYMDYGEYVFDYYPNLYSDLTLSCIDLNAYAEAEDALNTYFAELDTSLDVQNYPKLVRNRAKVRDFGSYSSDMNYGMVDVLHMLELLGDNSDTAKAATRAVESCIAYSDTNMENAGGISICYPYQTDEDYRDACIEMQEYLGFAPNYTRFLQDFYAIQNGDTLLADREISNAHTTVTTENDGTYDESDITLQLTPEQQANFASGGYYILCKAKEEGYITSEEDPRADEMYLFIQGSKRVTLDENGVLHAAYKNNALYMEDDDGVSDIPMILTESDISDVENRYLSFVVLMNFDTWEFQAVKLQIAVNEDYPDGIIRNAIPLSDDDDDVQSASKQLIRLDDYANMSVAARCSYVTRDENGDLLDFFDWETSKWMMGFEVDLTSDYRTVVQPLDHPENYVCIFFMKDSQGNVSYSDMIPLK